MTEGRESSVGSLGWGHGSHSGWLQPHDLVTSQRPHLHTPAHWGLGANIWILRDTDIQTIAHTSYLHLSVCTVFNMLSVCWYFPHHSNAMWSILSFPLPHPHPPSPSGCHPLCTLAPTIMSLTTLGHPLYLGFPNGFLMKERKKAINLYLKNLRERRKGGRGKGT